MKDSERVIERIVKKQEELEQAHNRIFVLEDDLKELWYIYHRVRDMEKANPKTV